MSKQTVTHAHPSGSFWARNRKSGGYLLRKTVRRKGYQLIRFLLLFGLCFMIIQPLLDKLSVSFMAERDLYDSTVISIPRHLTTANYSLAASKILLNYGTTFLNTLIVSLAVSVLQIAACTLVGYGFARFEFPFKKFWFAAVIITVIIPPQTISSSLYLHFNFFDIFGIFKATTGSSLNLRGSPIPYALMSATCMGLKNGLYIYMIRQFFTGIPKSLEEAAYVDGCSIFKTFWRVILPDAVPILVSCFLFSFVWQWTDTFYSKLFLGNIKLLSLEASTVADRLNSYVSIQLELSGGASGCTDSSSVCGKPSCPSPEVCGTSGRSGSADCSSGSCVWKNSRVTGELSSAVCIISPTICDSSGNTPEAVSAEHAVSDSAAARARIRQDRHLRRVSFFINGSPFPNII